MRYFVDSEFIEDGKTIDLISLGIVAEDGREYYVQSTEVDYGKASSWVWENVITNLVPCPDRPFTEAFVDKMQHSNGRCRTDCPWDTREHIRNVLLDFCDPKIHGKPEFWGYYADYDWVVLCQLFGKMMDLPEGWPMYMLDLKQLCMSLGNPRLAKQTQNEHNALADAKWVKGQYARLKSKVEDSDEPDLWDIGVI